MRAYALHDSVLPTLRAFKVLSIGANFLDTRHGALITFVISENLTRAVLRAGVNYMMGHMGNPLPQSVGERIPDCEIERE